MLDPSGIDARRALTSYTASRFVLILTDEWDNGDLTETRVVLEPLFENGVEAGWLALRIDEGYQRIRTAALKLEARLYVMQKMQEKFRRLGELKKEM